MTFLALSLIHALRRYPWANTQVLLREARAQLGATGLNKRDATYALHELVDTGVVHKRTDRQGNWRWALLFST